MAPINIKITTTIKMVMSISIFLSVAPRRPVAPLGSRLSCAQRQQENPSQDRDGTQDGWQGNGPGLVSHHMDRANVDDLFPGRVSEALVNECHNASADEHDGEEDIWFHRTF